ncbi:MAG TPA: N-acetylmuramic acid 6-phosphate etherase [Blastocatellia bacterium]|nr:N-acetylmuramic acid 6-phosphate etherase [Blastocatellia bacterium]
MVGAEDLVLGIEGGGTKTDWVYLSQYGAETTLLSRGQLPPSNLRLVNDDALSRILRELPRDATRVGVFLAGCVDDHDNRRLRELARQVWPAARIVTGSDRDSSLATAFGDGDGIAVISGTGSAVTGRRGGRVEKAGGRGHLLGDGGGGYIISMEGLRLALEEYDLQHEVTPLAVSILRELALNGIDELVSWAHSADKMSVARLTPVMFCVADEGDREMRRIIEDGARELALYTDAVARRLEVDSPEVRLFGGVFLNQPVYVELYREALRSLLPSAGVQVCERSGSLGAARLAAQGGFAQLSIDVADSAPQVPIEELAAATTEQPNPRSRLIDQMTTPEMIDLFIAEERFVADALQSCRRALADAVELIVEAFTRGGRLFYVGAGTSGRLGVLDASETPPTFGEPPDRVQGIIAGGAAALHASVEGAEDNPANGALALTERGVGEIDVVCGITASGRTPFVIGAIERAGRIGARTILLTCNPARRGLLVPVDVEIDLPTGPELIAGSTRLKAGTATKLALNILSTCSMIRMGKVKSNLMVDLKPTSEKLRDRAVRLVAQIKGDSYEQARARLKRHGWNVRRAVEDDSVLRR